MHFFARLLLTLLLVGVLCACFCGVAFAYYVRVYINPAVEEDVAQLSQGIGLDLNSFIYSIDTETGQESLYETIKGLENRVPVTIDQVPDELKDAVIAIEDQRFYQHKGVDWKGTAAAVKSWLLGGAQRGGSTITQQLIKNATKDDDYSVKRKVNEIFRALALEEKLDDKDKILESYLNTIYLGYNCYGVKTAAMTYFGKDVSELDLAECAVLAGLTNNPSIYDPYNRPEKVKERQELILDAMLTQGMISQLEHDTAKAKELVYRPYETYVAEQNDSYTWFTDAVIKDVINDLMAQKGYSELIAQDLVFSGGLKIYATIDTRVQDILDAVYQDDSVFPNMTRGPEGSKPQSAMVITDKQGNIRALVGGRGEKTGMRGFSRATDARRQPGSSIKPLAVYGPAMDTGIIVPTTTVYDKALRIGTDGKPWPMNDGRAPSGNGMPVKSGIAGSVNTIAVQVLNMLTPQTSFDYLTQRLGFASGDDALIARKNNPDGSVTSDIDLAPLALGGLTNGATVREMAGGFSAFINEGVFAGTRTYTKVLDSEGNVLLENKPGTELGFKNVRTAYYMLECMQAVTSYGTATNATIPGVQTAGKTGTTTANKDIWFCGVTPEYSAAVWVGFDREYAVSGLYGRNAAAIWTTVMRKVHEGDSGLKFDSHPEDFQTISYCMDSGLLPSGACRAAGRVATGRFWKDKVPTEMCVHKDFKTYDYGKKTGVEVKQEEEEQKPEEQPGNVQLPDNPSVDPEIGQPVTPPAQSGGTTDPGVTEPAPTDPGGAASPGGTPDPGGAAEPAPPPDDPEA